MITKKFRLLVMLFFTAITQNSSLTGMENPSVGISGLIKEKFTVARAYRAFFDALITDHRTDTLSCFQTIEAHMPHQAKQLIKEIINQEDFSTKENLLSLAISCQAPYDLVIYLVENGAQVNNISQGYTPLNRAVKHYSSWHTGDGFKPPQVVNDNMRTIILYFLHHPTVKINYTVTLPDQSEHLIGTPIFIQTEDPELTFSFLTHPEIRLEMINDGFLSSLTPPTRQLIDIIVSHALWLRQSSQEAPPFTEICTPLHSMAFLGSPTLVEKAISINPSWLTTPDAEGKIPVISAQKEFDRAENPFVKARYQKTLNIFAKYQQQEQEKERKKQEKEQLEMQREAVRKQQEAAKALRQTMTQARQEEQQATATANKLRKQQLREEQQQTEAAQLALQEKAERNASREIYWKGREQTETKGLEAEDQYLKQQQDDKKREEQKKKDEIERLRSLRRAAKAAPQVPVTQNEPTQTDQDRLKAEQEEYDAQEQNRIQEENRIKRLQEKSRLKKLRSELKKEIADLNTKIPLTAAVTLHRTDMITYLLDKDEDPENPLDEKYNNHCPLITACKKVDFLSCKALLMTSQETLRPFTHTLVTRNDDNAICELPVVRLLNEQQREERKQIVRLLNQAKKITESQTHSAMMPK